MPVYKICKLLKLGEDSDESCPKHTKLVHQNILFPLDGQRLKCQTDTTVKDTPIIRLVPNTVKPPTKQTQ